jgi:colicin import membrane protein
VKFRRCVNAVVMLGGMVLFSQACTVAPILPDKTILADLDEKSITTVEQARDAQRRIIDLKSELAFQERNEEIACYRRFFVNACLGAVDMARKSRAAQLRLIDGIAQNVIRQDRATNKNDALALSVEERQDRAQKEAVDRQEALAKTQTKTETQAQKLDQAAVRSTQDIQNAASSEASRLAKIAELEKKNAQARVAKSRETFNRQRFAAKRAAQVERIAKAADKQKNAKTRLPIEPRLPRPKKQ